LECQNGELAIETAEEGKKKRQYSIKCNGKIIRVSEEVMIQKMNLAGPF
jgi:hypothetical protein